MSCVDRQQIPIANAFCLPSAIIATTDPLSTGVIQAPGDVRPGHMIFAPLNTNRMAPLSTCSIGKKNGNLCSKRSVGIQGPSRCLKNSWSPMPFTRISMWSWLCCVHKRRQCCVISGQQNQQTIAETINIYSTPQPPTYHLTILNASFFGNITSI